MNLKQAYKIVYEDLKKRPDCNGKHFNEHSIDYMNAIGTLMELIAFKSSDEDFLEFSHIWINNITKAKKESIKHEN